MGATSPGLGLEVVNIVNKLQVQGDISQPQSALRLILCSMLVGCFHSCWQQRSADRPPANLCIRISVQREE